METIELAGQVKTWDLGKNPRTYFDADVPFSVFRKVTKPDQYAANSGRGEQRKVIKPYTAKLKKEMDEGTYTPAPTAAGLRPRHRKSLTVTEGTALLSVSEGDPLPLLDGQQRGGALESMLSAAVAKGDEQRIRAILDAPITVRIYLDGDTQADFVNLNVGKPVDSTLMFSLRMRTGKVADSNQEAVKVAVDAARLLHGNPLSPFHNAIRFDDRSLAPIPVMTVCARGVSDQGTSLVGVAKATGKDAKGIAFLVAAVYKGLSDYAPELLGPGRLLTPPLPDGTRGSATMLVGLATALGYAVTSRGEDLPSAEDLKKLAEAANATLSAPVDGNLSGPAKRKLLGDFCGEFFAGVDIEKEGGVPAGLLKALSKSAFGIRNPSPSTAGN